MSSFREETDLGDRWQVLKVVSGILFLLAAVLLELYGPQGRNVRILEVLFVFLGLFYILSPLAWRWFLRKMDQE
jgi:hypothetical protein